MKHLFALCSLLVLFNAGSIAQNGTITNISMVPNNPNDTDTIMVYADVSFPSGACILDNSGHNVVGNLIYGDAHHCVGLLTVICNEVDSFKIEPLPAGNYDFFFTLTSGSGMSPCPSGVVADDTITLSFEVTGTGVGINEDQKVSVNMYPNPNEGLINFNWKGDMTGKENVMIYDLKGRLVFNRPIQNQLSHNLPNGAYNLEIVREGKRLYQNRLVVLKE